MEKLDFTRFARCHNSYIVNLTKVRELSDKKFVCENGKNVPISKTYYVDVREKFLSYLDGGEFCGGGSAGSTLLILKPLYSYTDFFFRRLRRDDFFRNSCALVSK